ncbi:MAG TPA: ImmA/IrrE family metallo-endopeptidase [Pseudolysinimonas sp.]|nr:ImmA/IrrE family metallo-endopeptidase [Pseudolysinimonas sp.]
MSIRTEARAKARETLDAVWKDEGFPVDPIAVARRLGVQVYTANLPDDVSGMLRKLPLEAAEIYVDTDDPSVRQRFTCAHEVGHYVRHSAADDGQIAFVDYRGPRAARGDDPEEVFANEFAAALLMPEDRVRTLHKEGWRDLEMAPYFAVSLEAAKWRMVNLNLSPARG